MKKVCKVGEYFITHSSLDGSVWYVGTGKRLLMANLPCGKV